MGIPETLGNALHAVAEIVGAVTGDKKMTVKPSSVQRALSQGTPVQNSSSERNNNIKEEKHQINNNNTTSIYNNPDIYLTVPDLIQKYGYPFESHKVTTKDKYILNIFRIPHGRNGQKLENTSPVLLVHGLLNSAGAWIMHEPDKALAYSLADRGYDVWMLNSRGCTYSREHEEFSPKDKEFWNFSFHEMSQDVASVIDYICQMTCYSKLYYIGHSLGNTKLMIAANDDERIVEKIKLFICFAPAVYLFKTTAKLLSFNAPFFKQQKAFLDYWSGNGELMNKTFVQQVNTFSRVLPTPEYFAAKCVTASMYTMGGYNPEQIYWPQLPVIAGHSPSPSSVRVYIHCLQYFVNPEFQQYDYGSEESNKEVYGQTTPPKYDLSKVKCPTVIFYGENDLLCRPEAVEKLSKELPNVVECHRVECDKFSHTDFLYAKDIDKLVYNRVIDMLK